MRRAWIAIVLAPLAACVAPTVVSDHQRVARIDDVSVRPLYGQPGTFEVTARGTADGSGWTNPELRVVSDEGSRGGEITLAMFARPPAHFVSRGYDPARAYGGDTYYPPETSRWPSGRPAVDTYFGGGEPLEATLLVNPGPDNRILRVLGQTNETGGLFDTLASKKLATPRQMRRHEWFLSRRPIVEIGSRDNPTISWNGETLLDDSALEAKLREIASRPEPIVVRVRASRGASDARVLQVMSALHRYGVSAYVVDRKSRSESQTPANTDPTEPPSEGFFFTRGQ